jgi:hypothetical protein
MAFVQWALMYPIRMAMYLTIPDCRKTHLQKYFVLTFIAAILWIAVLSYVNVWMVG